MDNYKSIIDEKFITNLFRKLYKLKKIPVVAGHIMTEMLVLERKGNEIILENFEHNPTEVITEIKIGFFYNETFYSFTSIATMKESIYYIEKPQEIHATYKRQLNRYVITDTDDIKLKIGSFDNIFKAKDFSIKGLSFESSIGFEVGAVISMEIILGSSESIFVEGIVKYNNIVDSYFVHGIYFTDIDWFSIRKLFMYIFKNSYPNVKLLSEFAKESIHELFEPYLVKIPEPISSRRFDDMISTMNQIKSNQEFSASFVYVNNDNMLISTASALRIYNRTFLGHQLVAIPQSATNIRSRADIYFSLADYCINNKYFEYYISYYVTLLSWHDLMFKSIENYINDKNKFLIKKIQFYTVNTENICKCPQEEYQVNIMNDPKDFIEYCYKHLEPLEIKAYSYTSDFYMDEIKQVYEALGLYIARKLWCVKHNNRVVAYIVAESSNSGLNLFNLMDMSRFLFVDPEEENKQAIIESSLSQIKEFYQRYQKDSFNVVIQGENIDINIEVLIPNQSWATVIMNKEGGIEYKKLIKLVL